MNKLPKEIYVRIETEGDDISYMIPTETPDEHAEIGETRIVGVYKLMHTVEVSTQIKQEIVVKKSPAAKKKGAKLEEPKRDLELSEIVDVPRNPLLDELKVTS